MDAKQVATFKTSSGLDVAGYVYRNPDDSFGGWVAETAEIGKNVTINEGSVICPYAIVGDNAIIEEGCFIGECAKISDGCIIRCGTIVLTNSNFDANLFNE